ncbi:MAG: hypothetical protein JNN22_12485 [Rhodospirillales bacterium]|nr:hypothetical protein [Rhodospirillales bacterium]
MAGPVYTLKITADEAKLMVYLLRQAQMKGDSAIAMGIAEKDLLALTMDNYRSLADKLEEATVGKRAAKPQTVKKWLPGQTVAAKRISPGSKR